MIYLRRLRSYLTDLSFLCLLSVAFKASFSLFGILCFFSNAINSDSKAASSFTGAGILKLRYPYIMLYYIYYYISEKVQQKNPDTQLCNFTNKKQCPLAGYCLPSKYHRKHS